MKIEEGPAFGALIIGSGLGYLIYSKTQNVVYAACGAIAVALVDYVLLIWIKSFKK